MISLPSLAACRTTPRHRAYQLLIQHNFCTPHNNPNEGRGWLSDLEESLEVRDPLVGLFQQLLQLHHRHLLVHHRAVLDALGAVTEAVRCVILRE